MSKKLTIKNEKAFADFLYYELFEKHYTGKWEPLKNPFTIQKDAPNAAKSLSQK